EILSFRSGAAAWQLPADLIPEDGGDASALDGPNYYDETLYTPESYAAYSAALKSAHAVRVNRYSAQSVIDSAARALGEAEASLVEIRVRGDVDGDGDVTVSDALAALRIAAKLREPNPSELYAGDADGDGGVTVADALAILRAAVKLTDTL
ncbi:MAG: dockerin type I repeat-containing protein, partial [Clostridia bacterium]|nr:dockerin type I repeat-containing protein [Clostridia bacterium]